MNQKLIKLEKRIDALEKEVAELKKEVQPEEIINKINMTKRETASILSV